MHRDIKPSNLMFDENQMIKIVDFGLAFAEAINTNLTQGGEFLGTPSYMAPEQAKSPAVDHRADIYSLGITFYHMLYGKLPFQAGTSIEMVIKHTSHPFPPYEDRGGRISRSAYSIIEKMTQKDPAARYQDYASLIQDLEEATNELLHQSRLKVPVATRIAPVASFAGSNFYEILASAFTQAQTGVLTCKWNALEKRFLIRNREIVYFESVQPDENIWIFLVHKGKLKKEDLPASKTEVEHPLNRYLLNNAFTLEDFKRSYRELMISALDQVFLWPVFEGTFATASIENDAFCTVPLADFLLTAARSILDFPQVKQQVHAGVALKRNYQFDSILRTLNLNPEESFIASRFEGENITVETLNLLTGLPEEKIVRTVYALEKLGALQYKSAAAKSPHRRMEPPRVPPYSPPPLIQRSQPSPQPQVQQAPPAPPPSQNSFPSAAKPEPSRSSRPVEKEKTPPPKTPVPRQESKQTRGAALDLYLEMRRKQLFSSPSSSAPTAPPHQTPTPTPSHHGEAMVRMEIQKSDKMIEVEHHLKSAERVYKLAERKFEDGDYYNV
ncbi:MAG TPA: serine/threonine-protein kinase, partial [Acidobacteriota bacterium]|nr:serine/threonine-protein kinase [Acidobacteriota bacterium]